MRLEVRLIKKEYDTWCLEHNYNGKNKKTPLLFLKEKVNNGKHLVGENNATSKELKNNTLETIDFMLKHIDDVELIVEGLNYTYVLEETEEPTNDEKNKGEITEKDFDNFEKLVSCICELYGAPKIDLSSIKKDEKLFKTLLSATLGVEETFNVLTNICLKAELALAVDRLFENEENKGE